MHQYYQENAGKLKKKLFGFYKMIKDEIEQELGIPYEKAIEEFWDYYEKNLLEDFPYIGGDDVSGTTNLTGAFALVAIGEVGKKYGVSLEKSGYMMTLCYKRYMEKIPNGIRKFVGRFALNHTGMVNKALKKKDRKNRDNNAKNPGSFQTETQESTAEYPVNYHILYCPLYAFAQKKELTEYMPYLCNLDYAMFGALYLPMYRENACSDGDAYCDFKFKPDEEIPAVWPPHILDKTNPLK